MDNILNEHAILTSKPEIFLSSRLNKTSSEKFRAVTKNIFDTGVSYLRSKNALPIKELIVDGFDEEQIWQELELLHALEFAQLTREVSQVTARSRQLQLAVRTAAAVESGRKLQEGDRQHSGEDAAAGDAGLVNGADVDSGEGDGESEVEDGDGTAEESGDDDDDDAGDHSDDEGGELLPKRPTARVSAVDDQFFKLDELEQFLERQDQLFQRQRRQPEPESSADGGVDLFSADAGEDAADDLGQEEDEDEETPLPMFADFFDPPEDSRRAGNQKETTQDTQQGKRQNLLASDSDGEQDSHRLDGATKPAEIKSTLELRQERLRARISKLEEQNLSEKPWQQRGETSASGRQENALLSEFVEFEQARRAPVTTAEVTAQVEKLILRRVRDAAWDDVERKVKPVTDPYEYKKKLLLDQEKSKLSLAQVYEQEYLKQREAAERPPEVDLGLAHDEPEDVPRQHDEIGRLMTELFSKLDTLTNFHYMPKQVSAEVRIVSKLPAIAMEEVTPVAASNATLLAPEEVKDKRRSHLLAKEERTDTDKKRERRKKKHRQASKARARELRDKTIAATAAAGGGSERRAAAAAGRRLAEAQLARAERRGQVTRAKESTGKKALKSSKAFFSRLQDQVTAQVAGAPPPKKKKRATSADVAKMRL